MTTLALELVSQAAKDALESYDNGGVRDVVVNRFIVRIGGYPDDTRLRVKTFTKLQFGWNRGRDAFEEALISLAGNDSA